MTAKNGKNSISHDVSDAYIQLFDDLYEKLGPPKYRILEAAIEVFATLPTSIQYALKSNNQKDRKLCLDLIRAIEEYPKKGGADEQAKAG